MQGLKKILQLFLPSRDIHIEKGYFRPLDTLDECRCALGGFEPVLSRLGCISTEKHTPDGGTVIKNRIILDAKQSEVTSATSREYRSVMPRLTDAVTDALCMMSNLEEDETLEQLIADISDAFWLIPLHPKERRFFVASFQGKFLVFERTAQGSRGAPLTFCTIMGLATRLLQSLLLRDRLHMKRHKQDARTDDPWIIGKGTATQVNRIFSIVLLTWCLFGFPVATHKATRGRSLKWIGMYISLFPDRVEVSIPPDKVDELERMTLDFPKSNVVSVKALRTYVGNAMSIASVIFTWRPFLNQIFAAIHSDGDSNVPNGCIWLRQIEHSLLWFRAFFTTLKDGFLNAGPHVVIIWDASPFGIGAVLCINGAIVEYLHDTPSSFESDLLRLVRGDSESQQVMECLAGLVALRTWAHFWNKRKISLAIRSDNVGALILQSKLKTTSARNAIIAREFALDLGDASFAPRIIEHIPGFTNVICDSLSRLLDDSGKYATPPILKECRRVCLPARNEDWWRSIRPLKQVADNR